MDDFIYKQDPARCLSHRYRCFCGSEIALEVVPCLPAGLPGGLRRGPGGADSTVIAMGLDGYALEVAESLEQRMSSSTHQSPPRLLSYV